MVVVLNVGLRLSCRYESLQVVAHLQKPVCGKFCLPEPRYGADEFGDIQDLDVRVFRRGRELSSTRNHASNVYLSEFSAKLVVAEVGSSLDLVKWVVIHA